MSLCRNGGTDPAPWVSRIELSLVPTHPDRVGGLGFLANTVYAFTTLLVAHGVMLAAQFANHIFFAGASLIDFKAEIAAMLLFLLCLVFGPLLVFALQLAKAKRTGLREYGALAQQYVHEFDVKWLRGGSPAGEPLVGSGDIQSLADLADSYDVVGPCGSCLSQGMPLCASRGCGTCANHSARTDHDVAGELVEETVWIVVLGRRCFKQDAATWYPEQHARPDEAILTSRHPPKMNLGDNDMPGKIAPKDNSANMLNGNKGTPGTNKQHDQVHGNRSKQLTEAKSPTPAVKQPSAKK